MLDINTGLLLGQLSAHNRTDPSTWDLPPIVVVLRDLFSALRILAGQTEIEQTASQNADRPPSGSTRLVLRRAHP